MRRAFGSSAATPPRPPARAPRLFGLVVAFMAFIAQGYPRSPRPAMAFGMALGMEGFQEDLASSRFGDTQTQGPGAYDRLIQTLRAHRDDPRILAPLARAWAEREFLTPFARPLLVLAALRYRALADPTHPLTPEALLDAELPDLNLRFLEAFADPDLEPILQTRAIQTNEPGRALAWGLPALTLGRPSEELAPHLAFAHRGFTLIELGASAGLNLVVDRTAIPYKFGVHQAMGLDFPAPERRVGLDRAPIDLHDDANVRWLTACIWPGQPDRLARFEACRKLWVEPWLGDAPAPIVHAHALGPDTARALADAIADAPARPVLVFQTVVRPYLDPATLAAYQAAVWDFLAAAPNRLFATLEPDATPRTTEPMTLTIHMVRGGERLAIDLAHAGYHAAQCTLVPGGLQRAAEAWRQE